MPQQVTTENCCVHAFDLVFVGYPIIKLLAMKNRIVNINHTHLHGIFSMSILKILIEGYFPRASVSLV